jgi:hypothetical protein
VEVGVPLFPRSARPSLSEARHSAKCIPLPPLLHAQLHTTFCPSAVAAAEPEGQVKEDGRVRHHAESGSLLEDVERVELHKDVE